MLFFVLKCRKTVGKGHYTVTEVNILDNNVLMRNRQIVVAEVPERFYSERNQFIRIFLSGSLGDTEYRYLGLIFGDKAFHTAYMHYRKVGNFFVFLAQVAVKDTDKLPAVFAEVHVARDSFSEVACAEKHRLVSSVDAENFSYLGAQFDQVIAVALLSEAAEAVKVLTYL